MKEFEKSFKYFEKHEKIFLSFNCSKLIMNKQQCCAVGGFC